MRVALDRVTVGSDLYGRECLHVHADTDAALDAILASPLSDGVTMSSTTYHRAATARDVRRLVYDRDGDQVTID